MEEVTNLLQRERARGRGRGKDRGKPISSPNAAGLSVYDDVFGGPPKYTAPSFLSQKQQREPAAAAADIFRASCAYSSGVDEGDVDVEAFGGLKELRRSSSSNNSNCGFEPYTDVFRAASSPLGCSPNSNYSNGAALPCERPWLVGGGKVKQSMVFPNIGEQDTQQGFSDALFTHPQKQQTPFQPSHRMEINGLGSQNFFPGNLNSTNSFRGARDSAIFTQSSASAGQFSTLEDVGRHSKSVESPQKKSFLKDHVMNHIGLLRASVKSANGRSEGHSKLFSPRKHKQSVHESSNYGEHRRSSLSEDPWMHAEFVDGIFVTVDEVKLLTKPTPQPPPSRPPPPPPPPPPIKRVPNAKSSNAELAESKVQNACDNEVSAVEAASSSTFAMMQAMKKAEARSKTGKEGKDNVMYVAGEMKDGSPQASRPGARDAKGSHEEHENKMKESRTDGEILTGRADKLNKDFEDWQKEVKDNGPVKATRMRQAQEDTRRNVQEKESQRNEELLEMRRRSRECIGRERAAENRKTAAETEVLQPEARVRHTAVESSRVDAEERQFSDSRAAAHVNSREQAAGILRHDQVADKRRAVRSSAEPRETVVAEALERTARVAKQWAAKAAEVKQRASMVTQRRARTESRDRAAKEAKQQAAAERAAVERVIAEARERASVETVTAEAKEKHADDAKIRAQTGRGFSFRQRTEEKFYAEKAAEARLKAERAAVERAHAEARQRAADKAVAAMAKENEQTIDDDLEAFFGMSFDAAKQRPSVSNYTAKMPSRSKESGDGSQAFATGSPQTEGPSSSGSTMNNDLASLFTPTAVAEQFQEIPGESEEKRRARLERHQRTIERQAKALAEKNDRDLQLLREQEERNRLADSLDAGIKRWAAGKEGNLRALLSTLQYILWPESGWQPVSLTDIISAASVKKAYRKATLCVHPDKVQQKGATIEQKYIAGKVFDLLKEAWNKFNAEERM